MGGINFFFSSFASLRSARELTLWLLFTCKFVDRILECVGHQRASEDAGMQAILKSLQQLEVALPTGDVDESSV